MMLNFITGDRERPGGRPRDVPGRGRGRGRARPRPRAAAVEENGRRKDPPPRPSGIGADTTRTGKASRVRPKPTTATMVWKEKKMAWRTGSDLPSAGGMTLGKNTTQTPPKSTLVRDRLTGGVRGATTREKNRAGRVSGKKSE